MKHAWILAITLHVEKFNETVADPAGIANGLTLTNTISLPLTFNGGRFTKYLYLSASSTFSNDHIYLKDKGNVRSRSEPADRQVVFFKLSKVSNS